MRGCGGSHRRECIYERRHALSRRLVRQPPDAAAHVVEHMFRLRGPDTGHGDGRVTDDVLDEKLRPSLRVELGGPLRHGPVTDAPEEVAATTAADSSIVAEREERHDRDLPLLCERQDRILDADAIANVVVDTDEVDRLVAHDRFELWIHGIADHLHADVPDAAGLLLLLQCSEVRRGSLGGNHDQIQLGCLRSRQPRVDLIFHGLGTELRRAVGGSASCPARRPEKLALNAKLVGNLRVKLLRARRAVHRVVDSPAAVGKHFENLLERSVIRARRMVREGESDDRKFFTGRRDRLLNEFSARLLKDRSARQLKCAEQTR